MNDRYPPSEDLRGAEILDGSVIGAGALIMAGVRIGSRAVIGAGAVVTRDVSDGDVVIGVPARVAYGRGVYESRRHSSISRA
ncbi:MAG: hypothetical protein NZ957_03120 [Thaumarchaeota archaeon]|nr:hypothetical protein [Candidatus Calditenuaceae archaeon]